MRLRVSLLAGLGFPVSASSDNRSVIVLDDIQSKPHGLVSRFYTLIVIETWSKPPGFGSILSEPRLYTSIVIDLGDEDDGIFDTRCEPPGLGSTSIVIDLDEDDGADQTSSEPP